jgi:hypothetical protein
MLAKAAMAEDARTSASFHLCLSELNLLGDPTLPFRIRSPRLPKVTAPKTIPPGNIEIMIETDAPGALVALLSGTGMTYIQVADQETGSAFFPITVKANTILTVTVSGSDLNAVTMDIPVR